MPIKNFDVPEGKVLVIATGGYRFEGPCTVNLKGNSVSLPETFEDGTPTKPAEFNPQPTVTLPQTEVAAETVVEEEPVELEDEPTTEVVQPSGQDQLTVEE